MRGPRADGESLLTPPREEGPSMFGRFRKTDGEPGDDAVAVEERDSATTSTTVAPPPARDGERFARDDRAVVPPAPPRDWEPMRERRALAPVVDEDTVAAMRARQRSRFGGIRWGSAFFGLLSAIGLASILLGIAAA